MTPKSIGKIRLVLAISVIAFVLVEFVGSFGLGLMRNDRCFKYLGCNIGFFGYDAVVHFISGIMEIAVLCWLFLKYPRASLLRDGNGRSNFWKNFLILLAIAALISVSWEILEFIFDHFRIFALHQNLYYLNYLAQPGNGDTMGDLIFGLLGAVLSSAFLLKLSSPTDQSAKE